MLRPRLAVAERKRTAGSRPTDVAWTGRGLALLAGTLPARPGSHGEMRPDRHFQVPSCDCIGDNHAPPVGAPSTSGRSGALCTDLKVRSVVLRLARENEFWGLPPLHGELSVAFVRYPWRPSPDGLADPQERRIEPAPAPGTAGLGAGSLRSSHAQGILKPAFFHRPYLVNGTKVYVHAC